MGRITITVFLWEGVASRNTSVKSHVCEPRSIDIGQGCETNLSWQIQLVCKSLSMDFVQWIYALLFHPEMNRPSNDLLNREAFTKK